MVLDQSSKSAKSLIWVLFFALALSGSARRLAIPAAGAYEFHHHKMEDKAVAMTPQLFSISGLAVELGLDRRTVAGKMARIPPDGRIGKDKGWFLRTAMRVLGNGRSAPVEDDPLPHRNPIDAVVCVALLMVATRAPQEMALAAVQAGASPDLARAVFKKGVIRVHDMVDRILADCEIERDSYRGYPAPEQPNWKTLDGK